MRDIVHLGSEGHTYNFGVGDVLSDGSMVVRIDHERGDLHTARATWWRRAWYGARSRLRGVWWTLRCWAWDALDWMRGPDDS